MANSMIKQMQKIAAPANGQGVGIDIAGIKNMLGMLKGAKNPQAAIAMLAQQNPQFAQVMQMCQGQDLNAVAKQMCQSAGLDFDSLVAQLS